MVAMTDRSDLANRQQLAAQAAEPVGEGDGMAVASFVLGLIGLLLFNVVLGPCALVLGAAALVRGTGRRGRAVLGLALGAADLAVLAATILSSDGTLLRVWG